MVNLKFKVGDVLTNDKRTVILTKVEQNESPSKLNLTIYTVFIIDAKTTRRTFATTIEENYRKIGNTNLETLDILYGQT